MYSYLRYESALLRAIYKLRGQPTIEREGRLLAKWNIAFGKKYYWAYNEHQGPE